MACFARVVKVLHVNIESFPVPTLESCFTIVSRSVKSATRATEEDLNTEYKLRNTKHSSLLFFYFLLFCYLLHSLKASLRIVTMSLQSLYQAFLAAPSAAALADAASLNYITTLTTVNEPAAIVKHLAAQHEQLRTKQEKVIGSVESSDAICLDVETTLEFITSGGAYLPGLDDNFLADRVVTFPIVSVDCASIRYTHPNTCVNRCMSFISMRTRRYSRFVSTGTKGPC